MRVWRNVTRQFDVYQWVTIDDKDVQQILKEFEIDSLDNLDWHTYSDIMQWLIDNDYTMEEEYDIMTEDNYDAGVDK